MGKLKKIFTLFISTFYISACTFGGGFVIIPLLRKKFVQDLKWIEDDEMLNFISIAQSCPGAIAVNTSILIGFKIAGVLGALVCILGSILPPMIIISIISIFYDAFRSNQIVSAVLLGMQSGVAAVIVSVVIDMGGKVFKERDALSIVIMLIVFVVVYFFKVNAIYVILVCGAIGAIRLFVTQHLANKRGDK